MKKPQKLINEVKVKMEHITFQLEPITWVFKWNENGQIRVQYSSALQELTDLYYFFN